MNPKRPAIPKPPRHLATAGKAYFKLVAAQFELQPEDTQLLVACSEMLDRAESARETIAKEGAIVRDRFEQPKPHPAVEIERQSRLAFVRIRRELGLSVDPPDSRPPLPRGYR